MFTVHSSQFTEKEDRTGRLTTVNCEPRTNKGFTLIEMIVVIGAVGLLLPLLFSIVFAIVRQQVTVYRLAQVKREGDAVLNIIETKIKNDAIGIFSDPDPTDPTIDPSDPQCETPEDPAYAAEDGANFYFKDREDNWFQFRRDATYKLLSDSLASGPQELISDKVLVTGFKIECTREGDFSSPLVTISFLIQFNTPAAKPALPYQLTVKLRNE